MPTPLRRLVPASLSCLLVVVACTTASREVVTADPSVTSSGSTTTAPNCDPRPITEAVDLPSDASNASLIISEAIWTCAETVVVTTSSEPSLVTAVALAAELTAPLLVTSPNHRVAIDAELSRLGAENVSFVGSQPEETLAPSGADIIEPNAQPESATGALAALTIASPAVDAQVSWLISPEATLAGLAVAPMVQAAGGSVLVWTADADDGLSSAGQRKLAVVGDLDPTQRWDLLRPFAAAPLPGGGTILFPGRRIVALYGSPVTFRLGLLGEQGPQASIDRLLPLVEQYQIEGGDPVIPGFELIVTVADSVPGDDGDYSNELGLTAMQEWIDVATQAGAYVFIDLQPGRTDFLTQARRYESFLRLPNVGLALDPEWRLEPDEVHLRQIGSVDGAEVNQVVEYLAALVREENLPQKLLVLHQFKESMITNRHLISTPPELAVVVHVDGQGPLATKYSTFNAMLAVPTGPDQTLWWGWKNFIDEDLPTATAAQVNAVEPLPVVVTFQ